MLYVDGQWQEGTFYIFTDNAWQEVETLYVHDGISFKEVQYGD